MGHAYRDATENRHFPISLAIPRVSQKEEREPSQRHGASSADKVPPQVEVSARVCIVGFEWRSGLTSDPWPPHSSASPSLGSYHRSVSLRHPGRTIPNPCLTRSSLDPVTTWPSIKVYMKCRSVHSNTPWKLIVIDRKCPETAHPPQS